MKVAISTEGAQVAPHFGRCPEYTLVEIEEGKAVKKETIQNPAHQPGFLPGYLANMGVNVVITGGMGHRAQELFAQHNIETIIGVTGFIEQVIDNYLKGELVSGESFCDHDSPEHKSCEH
jgi:predicted Fe-Mo cluster-binding NifX family protein